MCGPPRRRPGIIERDDLVKRLVDAPGPLAVVAAPAGFGKSTTALLWEELDPRPFAWVQLARADDDPVHLLRHVACALHRLAPLDDAALAVLGGVGRSVDDEVLPTLARVLASRPPCVVVLDDVHVLQAPEALACVEALIDHAAPGIVIAAVGRSVANLRVARRRVSGQVVEVGPDALAFSADEARRVFDRAGLHLDAATVEALAERTEGWAAALHLAALRIDGADDPAARVAELTGRDRLVADYLVDEVLAGLDPPTVAFLERSSVLERMSAPLLDRLLDADDAGRRLAELEASGNLLLVPLDDDRTWYRYHHLFGELLRSRLWTNDPLRARALHARASELLELDGDVDGAIHQALLAHDHTRAARLAVREAARLVLHGRTAVLDRWVRTIGPLEEGCEPNLALAWAWAEVGAARGASAMRALALAGQAPSLTTSPEGTGAASAVGADVRAGVAALRAMVGADDLRTTAHLASQVVAAQAEGDPSWVVSTGVRGVCHLLLGEADAARADFEAVRGMATEVPAIDAIARAHLALLALRAGDLTTAVAHAESAVRVVRAERLESLGIVVNAVGESALVLAKAGRRDEARVLAVLAADLLEVVSGQSDRAELLGHAVQAELALTLDDLVGARRHLVRGRRLLAAAPDAVWVADALDRTEGVVEATRAHPPGRPALTPAELRLVPLLPTHLSLAEIAARLYISRNTAKTHSVAIYRKLGVASRAEAVAEARRIGLLDG